MNSSILSSFPETLQRALPEKGVMLLNKHAPIGLQRIHRGLSLQKKATGFALSLRLRLLTWKIRTGRFVASNSNHHSMWDAQWLRRNESLFSK